MAKQRVGKPHVCTPDSYAVIGAIFARLLNPTDDMEAAEIQALMEKGEKLCDKYQVEAVLLLSKGIAAAINLDDLDV